MEGSLWNGGEFPQVQLRCANVQMIRVESAAPTPHVDVVLTYFAHTDTSTPAPTYTHVRMLA